MTDDDAPSEWVSWWLCRIAADGTETWTHHRREPRVEPDKRPSRGSAAERGHHLGRGTRWLT